MTVAVAILDNCGVELDLERLVRFATPADGEVARDDAKDRIDVGLDEKPPTPPPPTAGWPPQT